MLSVAGGRERAFFPLLHRRFIRVRLVTGNSDIYFRAVTVWLALTFETIATRLVGRSLQHQAKQAPNVSALILTHALLWISCHHGTFQ